MTRFSPAVKRSMVPCGLSAGTSATAGLPGFLIFTALTP